jgi:hypothetical protein
MAAMRRCLTGSQRSALRLFTAAAVFCGVLLSVGLSAAPQLHNWLHHSDAGNHECAATLLSGGNWEHAACAPVLTAPQRAPVTALFITPGILIIGRAETSVLEHAPPANA